MFIKRITNYFSKIEIAIWSSSVILILLSFFIFDRANYMALIASLIGATSLIFCAKGNPIGQVLIIIFSALYGIISFTYAYYGEVITYAGMTLPMAVFALISWLKNPYRGNKSEVKVGEVGGLETLLMFIAAAVVSFAFYFILKYFGTSNTLISTVSVTTSFLAVYLTARRSPYYAVAYGVNDVVLIIMWIMASIENIEYISVVVCFAAFLMNDIYSFINWQKMKARQAGGSIPEGEL